MSGNNLSENFGCPRKIENHVCFIVKNYLQGKENQTSLRVFSRHPMSKEYISKILREKNQMLDHQAQGSYYLYVKAKGRFLVMSVKQQKACTITKKINCRKPLKDFLGSQQFCVKSLPPLPHLMVDSREHYILTFYLGIFQRQINFNHQSYYLTYNKQSCPE